MTLKIPSSDGDINPYDLTHSNVVSPRIHYVNGIRTDGTTHAKTAALLSLLTERTVWGVFNQTGGMMRDLGQSALDFLQNAGARAASGKQLTPATGVAAQDIPKLVEDVIKRSVVWNQGTVALFRSLMLNIQSPQMVVAHSQGNMLTSNALFIIERTLGSQALRNIRVYSLASPSPGWPLGLRVTNGGGGRQENAFMNDLVALLRPHNMAAKAGVPAFQNEGDFRTHSDGGNFGLNFKPHEIEANMALNFVRSIRNDLGLPVLPTADLLQGSAEKVAALFPK